jgi:hypothetical protein
MKKIILGLIATVLISSNIKAQSIDELKKSNNPFNSKGETFYNYLKKIQETNINSEKDLDEISEYINSADFEFNYNLNSDDIAVYENYFKNNVVNLKNMTILEDMILQDNFLSKNNPLLESIAIIKWGFFYQENIANRTFAGFEHCLDRCLAKKAKALFVDGNWVDQAEFMLSGGTAFAWWVASCHWDCLK